MNAPYREVEVWNRLHEVGAAVTVRRDDGSVTHTRTRSAAQVMGGHTAVIWVEGIAGCYLLSRVKPAPEVAHDEARAR